jgi:D-cysteine desulfhydrase
MMIPPGGSSPLGALAFAGAALELARQIERGECPVPERIYVSLGSSGSMAGLLVGIALSNLPSEVIGVRVTDRYMANEITVADLATRTGRLLHRLAPEAPKVRFRRHEISVIHDQFGEGYGHATAEGSDAERLAMEREGLLLDPTYTGKAMAGLISDVRQRPCRGPVLFWSTLNSVDLEELFTGSSVRGLPKALRKLYRQPPPSS